MPILHPHQPHHSPTTPPPLPHHSTTTQNTIQPFIILHQISQLISKAVHMDSEQEEESRHKNEVKTAFTNYSKDMHSSHAFLFQKPTNNQFYNHNQQRKAMMMEKAIAANQHFLHQVLQYINEAEGEQNYTPNHSTAQNNQSKIKVTIKQFYREWCGQSKEKNDYIFIKEQFLKYLKKDDCILVPGCGLGRLVFELVNAGFGAQGNELTYFMLFGSNFIINCCEEKEQFEIYPFLHSTSYYRNEEDIYRSVKVPEIAPITALPNDLNFSICAGQFTAIYNQRPSFFQGIATCFFLDTANNIFDYIDTISCTLAKGAIWMNLGPLLFHFKDMFGCVSIEVSWQAVKQYIRGSFEFVQECLRETTYCHDPRSDMNVQYKCIFFVCRKK